VLVYLRGRCPEPVLDMTVEGGLGIRHAPVVWNVGDDVAVDALADFEAGGSTPGILFWVPLMQGGGDPAVIARWRDLVGRLPEPRVRADLLGVALVFTELAGCGQVWLREMEGWQMMTESPIVNSWIEKAVNETRLGTTREELLRLLHCRFPGAVPPEAAETINAQPSRDLLHEWFDTAARAETIEEFVAALRR
jgi:hypothetical protein